MTKKYDFIIVGGGLVGTLASLVLSDKDYSVCLIEKNQFHKIITDTYSPLSLSLNSVNFLKEKKLWDESAFKSNNIDKLTIKLFNSFNTVFFTSKDLNLNSLGSVIDKAALLSYLREKATNTKNIRVIDNINVELNNANSPFKINISNTSTLIESDHLIVTDGANSKFAKKLGIISKKINYDQTSYIFNAKYDSVQSAAYQIFTRKGVFAILPGNKESQCLVATIHNKYIDEFNFENEGPSSTLLEKELRPYIKNLENFKLVYKHPLNTSRLDTWTQEQIIFLGNSSQLLHPFGAQGFNFAIDCIKTIDLNSSNIFIDQELNKTIKNKINKKRERLLKGIDLTSSVLMQNNAVANITASFFAKALNISSILRLRFLKRILNI
tara:strand:+ start:2893 stop:4038 length:1146 start_codon:yes stop_codon:yes gene_type:complete